MNALAIVLYFLHVIISLFLILVVLLQQGKGADLAVFGGGGTQAAFGARGAANIFHRLTVVGFVLFIVTTLSIGILQAKRSASTVMSGVAAESTDDAATTTDDSTANEPEAVPAPIATDEATDQSDASPVEGDEAATGEPEGENPQ